ncbi:MAG: NADP-dependent malic enzyme [Bacillota bacterium]|nr:NADP-dependent malic enzyme [Bacillota bacterium]
MDVYKASLKLHQDYRGKWAMESKVPIDTKDDLSLAYTPGVAQPCLEIAEDPANVYKYTSKWNTVAVISDGSAALGLGNIGGMASLPIMEGKCVLFKRFADIDAVPIVLDTQDVDAIVETAANIAPSFGGINLEDISAPRCFEVEQKLQERVNIPVFHDDQHGTAIVVLAAVINSCKVTGKSISDIKVAISGAGAAGTAIARMLISAGVSDVINSDINGMIYQGREDLDPAGQALAEITNKEGLKGGLADAMKGADVFIGVSVKGLVSQDMVKSMADKAVVLTMANPEPEIQPDQAKEAGAYIVGTGRSDHPNQVNNLLAFPGVFRGALDARASRVTEKMKLAAAGAIADSVPAGQLSADKILPSILDEGIEANVAKAVAAAWEQESEKESIRR